MTVASESAPSYLWFARYSKSRTQRFVLPFKLGYGAGGGMSMSQAFPVPQRVAHPCLNRLNRLRHGSYIVEVKEFPQMTRHRGSCVVVPLVPGVAILTDGMSSQ